MPGAPKVGLVRLRGSARAGRSVNLGLRTRPDWEMAYPLGQPCLAGPITGPPLSAWLGSFVGVASPLSLGGVIVNRKSTSQRFVDMGMTVSRRPFYRLPEATSRHRTTA